jgi:hypothetical protein
MQHNHRRLIFAAFKPALRGNDDGPNTNNNAEALNRLEQLVSPAHYLPPAVAAHAHFLLVQNIEDQHKAVMMGQMEPRRLRTKIVRGRLNKRSRDARDEWDGGSKPPTGGSMARASGPASRRAKRARRI